MADTIKIFNVPLGMADSTFPLTQFDYTECSENAYQVDSSTSAGGQAYSIPSVGQTFFDSIGHTYSLLNDYTHDCGNDSISI